MTTYTKKPVDIASIRAARAAISDIVHETQIVQSPTLSDRLGVPVQLKLEHLQLTGSFKLRGAANAIAALSDTQRDHGVVAVSTGNHGRGLAYAAKQAGARCVICMSSLVPKNKIDGIEALGAEVRIVGDCQDDAQIEVDRMVAEDGFTMLPPFDHPDIIAGQGTVGLEIVRQAPEAGTFIIPVSGGGLISGVALAIKAQRPDAWVIGVSMERGAAMYESQRAGKPVQVTELPTLADSLSGGIGLDNAYTFDMVRTLVDDFVVVNELDITAAIRHAYWHERQIIEGSGSVGIAALLSDRIKPRGPTLVLLSGGNIDMQLHRSIVGVEDVDLSV